MESMSCVDESTNSTESFSGVAPAKITSLPSLKLHRMGSGGSVVLDSDVNGGEMESSSSRKLPSSKYKGVVPQPNGRWGAQIYEKHQRVWLGTFNEEAEAARAYDIAARRFRGRDAVANFKTMPSVLDGDNDQNGGEWDFLNTHSKAEIVDMLRKHTYEEELQQSKRRFMSVDSNGKRYGSCRAENDTVESRDTPREVLFEKAVTPSDVGKLNRLVIPKQHAEKHFPLANGNGNRTASQSQSLSPSTNGVLMNFEDVTGKVWRFRYSYWNSSQSYVLTKGWSRFVKEKNLRAGDIVSFERSTGPDRHLCINWKVRSPSPVPVVRLFGVDIFGGATSPRNDISSVTGGKRYRESDLFGSSKKHILINAL